ncbi:MAG: hypothetical protein ACK56I_08130, partial [bacterium]
LTDYETVVTADVSIEQHPPSIDGILLLSLKELFSKVREQANDLVYIIRCCYFEIYNDSVYDLLNTH